MSQTFKFKTNRISNDFPLPRCAYEEVDIPVKLSPTRNITNSLNYYNNEVPDHMRLKTMKENERGYNNPFLSEVLKFDRSEQLKKINSAREQIKLIDYIKSKRELSQNPKILRYIRTEYDMEVQNKRDKVKEKTLEKPQSFRYVLTEENEPKKNLYSNTLGKLVKLIPKIPAKISKDIIIDNLVTVGKKYKTTSCNFDKMKTIESQIPINKNAYFGNYNDFKIQEAEHPDNDKLLHFDRKPSIEYNAITDSFEVKNRPPFVNRKWETFNENFLMMMNRKSFPIQGGLFTEFTNKNIKTIHFNKQQTKERLKKEKEEAEKNNNVIKGKFTINRDNPKIKKASTVSLDDNFEIKTENI